MAFYFELYLGRWLEPYIFMDALDVDGDPTMSGDPTRQIWTVIWLHLESSRPVTWVVLTCIRSSN